MLKLKLFCPRYLSFQKHKTPDMGPARSQFYKTPPSKVWVGHFQACFQALKAFPDSPRTSALVVETVAAVRNMQKSGIHKTSAL